MCSVRSSSSAEAKAAAPVTAASAATGTEDGPRRIPGTFKLRFPPRREAGRSYVSAVQPRGLPPVVAGPERSVVPEAAERRALQAVRDAFKLGPRSRYAAPVLSSHEYGWWVGEVRATEPAGGARLHYPIREILRVPHYNTDAATRRR